MVELVHTPPPPTPMPEIVLALQHVADARGALDRASKSSNASQLRDALRSASDFLQSAKQSFDGGQS